MYTCIEALMYMANGIQYVLKYMYMTVLQVIYGMVYVYHVNHEEMLARNLLIILWDKQNHKL